MQVVLGKAHNMEQIADAVNNKMVEFANRGFRSLGVAFAEGDGIGVKTKWEMLGLIPLFDPPRHDTHDTIVNCQKQVSTRLKLCCRLKSGVARSQLPHFILPC